MAQLCCFPGCSKQSEDKRKPLLHHYCSEHWSLFRTRVIDVFIPLSAFEQPSKIEQSDTYEGHIEKASLVFLSEPHAKVTIKSFGIRINGRKKPVINYQVITKLSILQVVDPIEEQESPQAFRKNPVSNLNFFSPPSLHIDEFECAKAMEDERINEDTSSVGAPSSNPYTEGNTVNGSATATRIIDTLKLVLRDAESNCSDVVFLNSRSEALRCETQSLRTKVALLEKEVRDLTGKNVQLITDLEKVENEREEMKEELEKEKSRIKKIKELF